jgi:deoxyhypusine synthase
MNVKDPNNFDQYLESMESIGFQSTEIARGSKVLKNMFNDNKTTRFISFTGNLIASGLRGVIASLIRKRLFHAIITTAGAIDHDIIKSFLDYEVSTFNENDRLLHKRGINRIGNILVNNNRYEKLEKICNEVFPTLRNNASASEIAYKFGKYIEEKSNNKENSFLYWAYKNNIPVFCPGITDGAIGLQFYFYMQKNKAFDIFLKEDMKKLAEIVLNADKTGALVIGGGISKHHVIGINIVRNGLDYAVYITTSPEFDGSLSGARSSEAISWGKIKEKANHADIHVEATVALPLMLKLAGVF